MASNRNRVALMGRIRSGKTTLMQCLQQKELKYAKTQQVTYTDNFIDTPGEFIEMSIFSHQAVSVSLDSALIIMVSSCVDTMNSIRPNFISFFNVPAIGVVTKIDRQNDEKADIARSHHYLEYAGIKKNKIFEVSSFSGEGIPELTEEIHRYLDVKDNIFR
ncbi:EutP/PduV family microcompartment system protein [Pseudoramibacter alactolyticus]